MINQLPEACKDCASYGSEFCEDCLEELVKDVPKEDRPTFNKALQNLAKAIVNGQTHLDTMNKRVYK